MEGLALMALLECPLCLEQLDASAKVLPCQHTFCTSCLQRQEVAHSQLLCPECRAPVLVRAVEELPANILLVRLLEGLRGSAEPGGQAHRSRYSFPLARAVLMDRESQQGHGEVAIRSSVRSKQGDLPGEQLLLPVNNATYKVEEDWRHGNAGDSNGRALQPFQQSQPPPALCRALCNFNPEEMNLEDSKICLSFLKGDILTVIRRLDEHWIEAKLGDKGGICPLQFTEPYSAAAKPLEGKSRRGGDSAEIRRRTGSRDKDKAADAPGGGTAPRRVPQVPAKTPVIGAPPLAAPRKEPRAGGGNVYQTAKGETSDIRVFNSVNRQGHAHRHASTPAARAHSFPSRVNSQRVRRHSDNSQKHLLQIEKKMTNETPPNISMALLNPQMTSAPTDGKNSTQQLSISVCAVLYTYKPRRPEELELRKGEMVGVYGKFKEGWLRGLSLRTGKVGILPNNYITPVLRTSARLVETKAAANMSSQHNAGGGKKPPASGKGPAVVLALDRVNSDGSMHPAGPVQSVPNGAQHGMSSTAAGKAPLYGTSQGWDTVRRIFNPHRVSNQFNHLSNMNIPPNSQHFAQVQASGFSPALQRKRSTSHPPVASRTLGWMSEPPALSAAGAVKDSDFVAAYEAVFQHERQQPPSGPPSILVRPDAHKSSMDKPVKSVRFLTDEDGPTPRLRTSSWSAGNQVPSNCHPGPAPLEVWAPSLTLGRDGPGIILKEGKAPVLRKGVDTAIPDLNLQKLMSPPPSLSAVSAQFSPSRHRVAATHLAQTDSELSLLQGELVLVHRPRPDGRVLVTQESSGQTGLFHSNVLHALERLS